MESFKKEKIMFISTYLVLEIITIILIFATFPLIAEYESSPSIIKELTVLLGFLSFYAMIYIIVLICGFKFQQDKTKRFLITLITVFLLNVFTIFATFEYADISVLHGSNLGFTMYKTYNYFFISFNLVGFGTNMYHVFRSLPKSDDLVGS